MRIEASNEALRDDTHDAGAGPVNSTMKENNMHRRNEQKGKDHRMTDDLG